jgi:hypothetical protein
LTTESKGDVDDEELHMLAMITLSLFLFIFFYLDVYCAVSNIFFHLHSSGSVTMTCGTDEYQAATKADEDILLLAHDTMLNWLLVQSHASGMVLSIAGEMLLMCLFASVGRLMS